MTKLACLLCLAPLAVAQYYNISTVAGTGRLQFQDSGAAATNARLIQPAGIAIDSAGNIYLSDTYYNQVFQISPGGTITVYAGNGQAGFSGDGGAATAAALNNPQDLAVDSAGNLYICDYSNSRIRKVSASGTISTLVSITAPYGIDIDAAGNLYVSQSAIQIISKVSPTGTITKIAGTGQPGYSGDGGAALSAMLYVPEGLRLDKQGNIFVADTYNYRIRKITPQGTITTVAGNGKGAFGGDNTQATSASLFYPTDVALDATSNLYIADATNERIRMVNTAGVITTVAGGGNSLTTASALQALLTVPTSLAIDGQGNVLFPLVYARQVRRLSPSRALTTIAGALPTPGAGDNIPAVNSVLIDPVGLAADRAGNIYIGDQGDNRVRKVLTNGIITTLAGDGLFGSTGDGGQAINAEIGNPRSVSVDQAGNVYVMSPIGAVIRKITPGGTITTFAGGGGIGTGGDGGPANKAQLNVPAATVEDTQGNVYISDDASARIRRVDTSGIISTIAGTGTPGYSGDNGPATSAQLYRPQQLATDSSGNLYIADQANSRIRKITPNGIISTIAGNGTGVFAGDGGAAIAAGLPSPTGLVIDAAGNLYVESGPRIRKLNAANGTINTIAGGATSSFSGDGGLATLATMNLPLSMGIDGSGNIYVNDEGNQRIRQLSPAQLVREGVTNGATFASGAVAPGEIVTIFGGPGISVGPAAGAGLQLDSSGRVATQIGGVQALFDGIPAALTYVNGGQINAVVPYEVAGKTTTQLQVMIQGAPTNTITLNVAPSSPGVFAITNQDGSVNSASNPSQANGVLVLYGTGEGATSPSVADGNVNATVFPKPVLPVSVQIGGQNAAIQYAGAAPGFVAGVLQVNIQIPASVTGTVPLQLKIGDATTPAGLVIYVH